MNTPTPRRPPPVLILSVALAGLVVGAALLGWLAWQFSMLPPLWAIVCRVVVFVGVPIEAGALIWQRWGRTRFIAAHHATQIERARNQAGALATTYHHAPQITHAPTTTPTIIDQASEVAAPPSGIPTFADLLARGTIGPGKPLLLGFDAATERPIEGSWDDLYSCGIGALQGAGKSWLQAFLLAQSALQGGRMIICDLNANHPTESLAARIAALRPAFMCEVASTPEAILSALKLADDKLTQRRDGKGGDWPIIIAIDEWTSMLRTSVGAVLPTYALNFAEQGRKFNVNGMFSAQGWTQDKSGDVRNRLTAHFIMRQDPREARYQLGFQAPLDVRFLPDATGYLLNVRGDMTKFIVPRMTMDDLERVGAMIPRGPVRTPLPMGFHPASLMAPPEAATTRERSGNEAADEAASTASGRPRSGAAISPEAARVYAAWKAGRDVTDLAKESNGGKTSGDGYKQKLREINNLLREAIGGTE